MFFWCLFLPLTSGRAPETKALGLDKLGVQLNNETGKIVVGPDESTSVPNIFAFGDIGEVGVVNRLHSDSAYKPDNSHRKKTFYLIISLNLDCCGCLHTPYLL